MGPLDAVGNWFAHTLQYGDVPQYLTGAIALFALWFARKAAIAARAANTKQDQQIAVLEEDRKKRLEDERTAQARSIAIWYVVPEGADRFFVLFSNSHPLPATKVVVSVAQRHHSSKLDFIPTEMRFNEPIIDKILYDSLHNQEFWLNGLEGIPGDELVVAFTDMNGARWSRNVAGELIELPPDQETKFHPYPNPD